MQIILNGVPRDVTERYTLDQLVLELDLNGKRFAIEVNETVVPRSQYASWTLAPEDKVEVVQAIGGG